jgi:hypothetical protein
LDAKGGLILYIGLDSSEPPVGHKCRITPKKVSGFRLQTSGERLQTSGFRLQAKGFRLQASDFRRKASGFRLQTSGAGTRNPSHVGMNFFFILIQVSRAQSAQDRLASCFT